MNEADLIAAYGGLTPEDRRKRIASVYEKLRHQGYRKCHVPGCITLIAIGADRVICRFHARGEEP